MKPLSDERIYEIYGQAVIDNPNIDSQSEAFDYIFAHAIEAELDKQYEPLVAELEIVEQAKKCYPRDGIIKAIEQTRIDNENSEYIKNILDNPPTFAKLEQEG